MRFEKQAGLRARLRFLFTGRLPMAYEADPLNRVWLQQKDGRWVVRLSGHESDAIVRALREMFAPSVESVQHIAFVAGPYRHQTPFLDVETDE